MDLKVKQDCPQCGGPVILAENDRLLTCPFCGVKNFLQTTGPFRYILPNKIEELEQRHIVHAPYIRFKSNIFSVSEKGIQYQVIDTTQLGNVLPGLPPTLGMRPQAMKLARLTSQTPGSFLHMSIKAKTVLEKAVQLSGISGDNGHNILHRSLIGDTASLIYLPLMQDDTHLLDAVTNSRLVARDPLASTPLKGKSFSPRWQVRFLPTLCPGCGWNLEGAADGIVLICSNCDAAWEIGNQGLRQLEWFIQPGDSRTGIYLAYWKISARIPTLDIKNFGDFMQRTNQPVVHKPQWHELAMSFWIPAFKLRPKIFLRTARQVTINQWRLEPADGYAAADLYPVTLPGSEAKQAIKITLAACATSPKNIFPFLPETRIKDAAATLVFLPFIDRGHDWQQPHSGTVIAKSILRFGRKL